MMIATRQHQTREIRGPAPNSVALIARPVSKRAPDKALIEHRQREDQLRTAAQLEKFNRMLDVKNDWEAAAEKRTLASEVQKRFESLVARNEQSVEIRRHRLRALLESEHEQHMQEMTARVETPIERQARLRERAKELKSKREAERLTFVQEKLEQQFREQCEELRSTLSLRDLQDVAAERREQLKQKEELDRKKKEEEDLFAKWWVADSEAKAKREEEDAKRQLGKNLETVEFLKRQMAEIEAKKELEKALVEEEAKLLQEEAELRKLEKQQELEEKRRKQQELRDLYGQSIQMKRANEAREMQEQLAFDRMILEQLLEKSKVEEIEEAQKKKDIREEERRYREYLRKLKEEERLREIELERLCDAEVEKMWEKRLQQWKVEKLARQKLLEEVLESRKKQIEDRLQKNLLRREQVKRDREELMRTIENNKQIENAQMEEIRRQNLQYQQDLKSQMAYNARQYRADLDEEQRMLQRQRDAETEYRLKVEDLRARPVLEKIHPFRRNRYFAEKMSLGPAEHFRSGVLN